MSKISDELRKWGYGFCGGTHDVVTAIADRIDAEMVELPKDRDGASIHVGDTVYLKDGRKAEVTRIDLMPTNTCIVCWTSDKKDVAYLPSVISHKQTDSFERIADELDDFADGNYASGLLKQGIKDFAERVRKLAKERKYES